ncbi:MAG: disulfide bond formation protein B [Pseudomonadota bacterium]
MSVYGRILLAVLGSAALLLGALGFQYLGELAPCPMCIWQRWPHVAAVVLGIAAMTVLWRVRRGVAAVGAVVMVASAGLGLFHAGVEQRWWQGPASCSGADPGALSTEALLDALMEAPMVRCDEIVWDLFGLTMAGWNALISVGLALLWGFAAWPKTPTRHVAPG